MLQWTLLETIVMCLVSEKEKDLENYSEIVGMVLS